MVVSDEEVAHSFFDWERMVGLLRRSMRKENDTLRQFYHVY